MDHVQVVNLRLRHSRHLECLLRLSQRVKRASYCEVSPSEFKDFSTKSRAKPCRILYPLLLDVNCKHMRRVLKCCPRFSTFRHTPRSAGKVGN
jgi:hypothetical protein